MEALKELIRIITPGKLRFIQLIGDRGDNHIDELYKLMHASKIQSIEEVSQYFYSDSDQKLRYSRNLKSKLFKRLMNTLFLIAPDERSSATQKAYFICYRNFAALKILSGLGVIKSFVPLTEKTIRKAKAYGFNEIVASLACLLRRYYGELAGDIKKYQHYAKLALEYDELVHAENLAEYYNTEFLIHFSTSRAAKPHLIDKMQYYIDTLEKYTVVHNSPKLHFCYFRLLITKFQIQANHEKVIEIAEEARQHFLVLERETPVAMRFLFYYYAIPSCIHLGRFSEALQTIRECLTMVAVNTYNYFAVLFYQVLLGFHSENRQLSEQAIDMIDQNKIPTESLKEQWRIVTAYVHFCQDKDFRLGKFLNQVPIFDQDKRGNKINILILQILFLLRDQRYNEIFDRIEALKQYTHRYLRKDETFRSNCFVKMLLQLPQANFHKVAVERKAKPFLFRLQKVPINLSRQGSELEIIPYEVLWKKVVEMLDEKAYSSKRSR